MKFSDIKLLSVGDTIGMVGAVYLDEKEEQLIVFFFPGEYDGAPRLGLTIKPEAVDMTVEDWTAFLRQTDLLETEILAKESKESATFYKAIVRKSQRSIDQIVSWRVYKRDQYRCRYCGNDNIPLTVDHLVLWEKGGPSTEANLLSCCKKCNKVRGNMPYAEWLTHAHYARVSAKLDDTTKRANEALVATLDKIPLNVHIKSR